MVPLAFGFPLGPLYETCKVLRRESPGTSSVIFV